MHFYALFPNILVVKENIMKKSYSKNNYVRKLYDSFIQNWGRDDDFMLLTLIGSLIMGVGVALNSTVVGVVGGTAVIVGLTGFFYLLGGLCSCH